jgi:Fe(3+) dicitrate transport protein
MTGKFFTDAANTEAPNATATIGLLEGYQTLDLSLGYEPYRFLRISAGVNNALNEKYATRRAGGYPGPGILPGDGRNYYLSARFLF